MNIWSRNLPIQLLCLGFLTSGILVTANLPVVGTRLAPPDLFLVLFVASTFYAALGEGRISMPRTQPIRLLILLFLAQCSIGYVYTAMLYGAELDGIVDIANYVYGATVAFCTAIVLRSYDDIRLCLLFWILGGVIVGVFALWGIAGGAPSWVYDGRRISSTLRSVNQMQPYLVPMLLAACMLTFSKALPWLFRIALPGVIGLISVGLLATGSRSAVVMLALLMLFVSLRAVYDFRKNPMVSTVILALVGIGALVAISVTITVLTYGGAALPEGSIRAIARPIRLFSDMIQTNDVVEALGSRGTQLEIVSDNWTNYPFWGVGLGNFQVVFDFKKEVHNTYLGVLIEQGLIGLFLLFGLLGIVLKRLMATRPLRDEARILKTVLIGVIALLLIYGLTSFGLRQRVFWLSLGMAMAFVKCAAFERRALHISRISSQSGLVSA